MPTTIGKFTVFGAIEQKWLQMGGANGSVGAPLSDEAPTYDTTGRAQNFSKGVISWHPATGAHVVWGAILGEWIEMGRERFGYPITDEMTCPDSVGRFNHFRAVQLAGTPDSSIYWSPASGARPVYGAIRAKWAELGWERGTAGYPAEAEHDQPGSGRSQRFQNAIITWTGPGGAAEHTVTNDSATFDSGPVTSSLPLNGSVNLVVQRNGNFTFSVNAHDSGFDNISYGMSAVLVTATGSAFTFQHGGHVEGTSAGLPFGTPQRNDHFTTTGSLPQIAAEWDAVQQTGCLLPPVLTGEDKLLGALQDLLADAAKQLIESGVKAVITAVAA